MSDYLDSFYADGSLTPITAGIGFNDGANGGFWRIQPRVKFGKEKGRWIEMGAEVRAAFKVNGKVLSAPGQALGSAGDADTARVLIQGMSDMGIPDGIYAVKTKHLELIGATLPDEYLIEKGIDPSEPNAQERAVGSILNQTDIPELADMESAPITPDDLRLAEGGDATPEGMEQANFKNTPEGQAIANLPAEAADVATPEEVANLVDGATPESTPKSLEETINDAIAKAADRGGNISLDNLIMAAEPEKKSSKKKKSEDGGKALPDLGDDNQDPEVPVEDIFNQGPGEQSDLTGARSASYQVTPEDVGADDIILGPFGDPVKITRMNWGNEGDGEDPDAVTIDFVDAAGNEDSMDANRYDDITMVELEPVAPTPDKAPETAPEMAPKKAKAAKTPKPITPKDATPETPEEPALAAPDTAKEIAASEVEVGDTWYSKGGATELGKVTAIRNNPDKPGQKQVRLSLDGRNRQDWWDLNETPLINKGEKAPEAPSAPETPEAPATTDTPEKPKGTSEQATRLADLESEGIDDPALAAEVTKVLDYQGPISDLDGAELDDLIARVEDHISKKPAAEAPKAPEKAAKKPVAKPDMAETPAKDRTDNGQEISFPEDVTEAELFNKKVSPLRDSDGNRVKAIDPDTGEELSTFAEDPDAVFNALLDAYPDAVVTDTGAIVLQRKTFVDGDGQTRTLESRVTRTNGANYMVSFKVTNADGTSEEYFSHDYRDSFSSIHGKTNGIQRLTDVLLGNYDAARWKMDNRANREWKKYFATNLFNDRLKYFRGKTSSNATRESLEADLAKAKASRDDSLIDLAQYNLDLLNNDFGGDIGLYRANADNQNKKLLTINETIDKFANGRFRKLNRAKGKSRGTVLTSTVNGIFGSIKEGNPAQVAQVMKELLGRLPDVTKDNNITANMLQRLEDGAKVRYPSENRRTLRKLISQGDKILAETGLDLDVLDSAPHISSSGRVISKDMLVQFTSNEDDVSVGYVHSLVPISKNANRPNEYNDYVNVVFRNQDGSLSTPVEISAKNLEVLDETGISDESLKRLTAYTPNLRGEELRQARFGDAYLIEQMSKDSLFDFESAGIIGEGFNPPEAKEGFWSNDSAVPGRYLYDQNGLPLGKIAAVRDLKSESGEDGYSIAYVTPDGKLQFVATKAGETRAPKEGLSKADGRGSNDSDSGFTPNPADFADVGLDAASIGSGATDPEIALIDTIKSSPMAGGMGVSSAAVAKLVKLKQARAAYDADQSDSNKQAYKDALTGYYGSISNFGATTGFMYNRSSGPLQVPTDDILSPEDIADINAKIRAIQQEKPKPKPDAPEVVVASYDDIIAARSSEENTYSGFVPEGYKPQAANSLDSDRAKHADIFKQIITQLAGGDDTSISDGLADTLAEGLIRFQNTDAISGQYKAPIWDTIDNEFGDAIRVARVGEPSSGQGYVATDEEIQTVANVFKKLRDKLNIGDKPLDFGIMEAKNTPGAGGALGFVYTADLWSGTSIHQPRAHVLSDTLPDSKQRLSEKRNSGEKFVPGQSWWSVDLSKDPELLMEYVTSHEMGHVMQAEALRQFGQQLSQATWNKFYGPVAKSHRVSQYGTSNNNEHFAESFVKWLMTGKAHPDFLKFLTDTGLLKSK